MTKNESGLNTLDTTELTALWHETSINPTHHGRVGNLTQSIYYLCGLDWRDPAHKAHVDTMIAPFAERPRGLLQAPRETND